MTIAVTHASCEPKTGGEVVFLSCFSAEAGGVAALFSAWLCTYVGCCLKIASGRFPEKLLNGIIDTIKWR